MLMKTQDIGYILQKVQSEKKVVLVWAVYSRNLLPEWHSWEILMPPEFCCLLQKIEKLTAMLHSLNDRPSSNHVYYVEDRSVPPYLCFQLVSYWLLVVLVTGVLFPLSWRTEILVTSLKVWHASIVLVLSRPTNLTSWRIRHMKNFVWGHWKYAMFYWTINSQWVECELRSIWFYPLKKVTIYSRLVKCFSKGYLRKMCWLHCYWAAHYLESSWPLFSSIIVDVHSFLFCALA